jgi:PAS domain S-box-containing protein
MVNASEVVDGPRRTARVLVVDDDESARKGLETVLRSEGFLVDLARDGAAALQTARERSPDVVITDMNMPVMDGVELCGQLHELDPDLPVVLVGALGNVKSVVLGMRPGGHDFLTKPLQVKAVVSSVVDAVERRAAKLAKRAAGAPLATEEARHAAGPGGPSRGVFSAESNAAGPGLAGREQLARMASELRSVNERLVVRSIRDQEQAEEEARQRAQLDALLGNLSEGVIVADAHGQIRIVSAAARHMLGLEDRPLRTLDELNALEALTVEGAVLPVSNRPLSRALRGEEFDQCELLRVRPDGEKRRLLTSGTNVRDERGEVDLAILVFRDVTELRRLERQREEYTALISHDLRTPLGSIHLLAETIRRRIAKNASVEEVADLAERIRQNAARMNTMVQEILDVSRLEAGAMEFDHESCDLRALVAHIIARLDEVRARRIVVVAEDMPYTVLGDAPRLDRAITNLLTNALKYSPDDADVRVVFTRSGPEVKIHIVDRGIGMPSEDVAGLFDRYYRAPSGKLETGIGLGLYITRLLAEAHGGRIEVESAPGKGSTFTLVLPSHPSPQ